MSIRTKIIAITAVLLALVALVVLGMTGLLRSDLSRFQQHTVIGQIILIAALAVIISWTGYVLVVHVTNPLHRIAQRLHPFVARIIPDRLDVNTSNEVRQLATSFSAMMEYVQEGQRTMENVIERRTAKIERERAKVGAILASIGRGLIATDGNGRIISINKQACSMLGCRAGDVAKRPWQKVLCLEDYRGDSVPPKRDPVARAMLLSPHQPILEDSFFAVPKTRPRFPVDITATPIVLHGETRGAVLVFRDITQEKQVDKAKTEFVSLASHQLRTPISAIHWYAALLLDDDAGELTHQQKEFLSEIKTNTERIEHLIDALLNVSRLELGTFAIERNPVDIVAIARDVLNELEPEIKRKRITVRERYDDLPTIPGDETLVTIIFHNLLMNAIKYNDPGGVVTLEIRRGDIMIEITVSDTGYGIPTHQWDSVFDKLFRAENVQKRDTMGTGLGLYMVKSILDEIGGSIWFESEEGKGTAFYVTLPLEGMEERHGTKGLRFV